MPKLVGWYPRPSQIRLSPLLVDKLILVELAVSQSVKRSTSFSFFEAGREVVSQVVLSAVDAIRVENDFVCLVLVANDSVSARTASEGVLFCSDSLLVLRCQIDCLVINFLILAPTLQLVKRPLDQGLIAHIVRIIAH